VGPPPPGATRGFGVLLASYCYPAVYASRVRLSTFSTLLFTLVRGREILRSSCRAQLSGIMSAVERDDLPDK